MNARSIVLLSGGLDSTVLLAQRRAAGDDILALNIAYGQRHEREIAAARDVAEYYKVVLVELNLASIFQYDRKSTLLQDPAAAVSTSTAIPQGMYKPGETPSTYVAYRNGLFLSVAASIAYGQDCETIYYGAHMGDTTAAYPDCSEDFIYYQNQAILFGTAAEVGIEAPFAKWSKAQIVKLGFELGVPFGITWSCYEGGAHPCGTCATCVDRSLAFAANKEEQFV